jgi:hypothetical protein
MTYGLPKFYKKLANPSERGYPAHMASKKRAATGTLPAKRMGRPKVPDAQRLAVKVTIPLTQADWTEVETTAAKRGISPTDLIRERIRRGEP